ncbi:hypothetical protein DXE50_13810 [Escherichia coli O145]|uniref:Uncharacterized protein n=1 Tax=Escherichia coli O145 TaxID=1055538 RepID=A0A9Q6V0A3_ECOLX|nr:hypothetical protein DXE50_13810 [Escherichia coli O145]GEH18304.1 transposase [Escherichia coli O145:H28]
MLPSETMIWQPEFTDKTLSRKPGAVQAVQIKHLEPDFIIFASGARRTDYIIKQVLTELGGYETSSVIPGKLWEFKTGNTICFRIAHPRAMRGHQKYRDEVIARIKQLCTQGG